MPSSLYFDDASQEAMCLCVVFSVIFLVIIFPLILITSNKSMMRVRVPAIQRGRSTIVSQEQDRDRSTSPTPTFSEASDREGNGDTFVDYSNSWLTIVIAVAIWGVIVAANCYVIVSLIMGNEG